MNVPTTFEELLSLLKEEAWFDSDQVAVDRFKRFIRTNSLESRYMKAIQNTYKNPTWDFERDIHCAEPASFISCFIDWEENPEENWREYNELWQMFRS